MPMQLLLKQSGFHAIAAAPDRLTKYMDVSQLQLLGSRSTCASYLPANCGGYSFPLPGEVAEGSVGLCWKQPCAYAAEAGRQAGISISKPLYVVLELGCLP
jgi:hypothetical protein